MPCTKHLRGGKSSFGKAPLMPSHEMRESAESGPSQAFTNTSPLTASPNDLVKIFVGPSHNRKQYTIHKSLLCTSSPFMSRAFNGAFAESTTQSLALPEIDPDTFDTYILRLYHHDSYRIITNTIDNADALRQDFLRLAKLSVLATSSMMKPPWRMSSPNSLTSVKNTMSILRTGLGAFRLWKLCKSSLKSTPEGHPLRSILLNYVYENGDEIYASLIDSQAIEQIPVDFLKAVSVHFLARNIPTQTTVRNLRADLADQRHLVRQRDGSIADLNTTVANLEYQAAEGRKHSQMVRGLQQRVVNLEAQVDDERGRVIRRNQCIGRRDAEVKKLRKDLQKTDRRLPASQRTVTIAAHKMELSGRKD